MTLSFSLGIGLNDHASGAAKILSAERCSMTTHGRGDGAGAPRTAVVIACERDSTESGTNRDLGKDICSRCEKTRAAASADHPSETSANGHRPEHFRRL